MRPTPPKFLLAAANVRTPCTVRKSYGVCHVSKRKFAIYLNKVFVSICYTFLCYLLVIACSHSDRIFGFIKV